jgi:glutamate dehydrogenase (NADP+)
MYLYLTSPITWLHLHNLTLQGIMKGIYYAASSAAKEFGVTLQAGANIAGFLKVARAMVDQGCV